ncbi:MAG: carbohydrate porin [Candidatus Rifleibacteriota bacterium]
MKRFGMFIILVTVFMQSVNLYAEGVAHKEEEFDFLREKIEKLEEKIDSRHEKNSKKTAEWYEKFDVGVGLTGVFQTTSNVKKRLNPDKDVTDGTMSFDLEITNQIDKNNEVFTLFESGSGDGVDGNVSSLSGFNDDADDDENLRLTEAWYETRFANEKFRFRLGKLDLTTDFDTNAVANCETEQFFSTGFVNNLAIGFPDDNGPGLMFFASLNEFLEAGVGLADADADWDNLNDDLFSIFEVNYKPKNKNRPGNYRFFCWANKSDHVDLTNAAKTGEINHGYGFSFDQMVSDATTVFARYGQQRETVAQIEKAWSTGFQTSAESFGRKDDIIGFAYGKALTGNSWRTGAGATGINCEDEHHAELYYSFKVNENLKLSPDIQWLKNAEGDKDNKNVWAFGVRAQLSF